MPSKGGSDGLRGLGDSFGNYLGEDRTDRYASSGAFLAHPEDDAVVLRPG